MSKIFTVMRIFALAIGIASCGGGGDTTLLKMTGYINDGAISNARVCLDLNSNGACDTDEPSAISGTGGLYSFNYPAVTDISKLHVLAIIDTNATDEDYGRITKPYNMLAPATSPSSVSPLTTLISTDMMVRNVTATDAESKLKREYGITKTLLGLNVANDADLHAMAQVTAISLAEAQRVIKNDAAAIAAGLSNNDVLKQSVQQVKENVLKSVVAAGGKVTIDTSSPKSQEAVLTNINAQLPNALANVVTKNIPAVITSARVGDGADVNMVEVFRKGLVLASNAGGGSTAASDQTAPITFQSMGAQYYQCDPLTMSATDSCIRARKFLDSNRWIDLVSNSSPRITFDGVAWITADRSAIGKPVIDGNCVSAPMTPGQKGGLTYCAVAKNLSGKSIKSVLPDFCKSGSSSEIAACNPDIVFPPDSIAYDFNASSSDDDYEIDYNDSDQWGGYGYNGEKSIAAFIANAKTKVVMIASCNLGMMVDSFDENTGLGKLKFALRTNASGNGCFSQQAEKFTELTDFYVKNVGGKAVMVWGVPNSYKKLNNETELYRIFVFYAGPSKAGIYGGTFRPKGKQRVDIRFTGQLASSPQVMSRATFDTLLAQKGKPAFAYPTP